MPSKVRKKPAARARAVKQEASKRSYEDALRERLPKVREVDAVYFTQDHLGTVHVYSVVEEYGPFYERLMRQERLIEKDYPDISFDFHFRARQARQASLAVPFFALLACVC